MRELESYFVQNFCHISLLLWNRTNFCVSTNAALNQRPIRNQYKLVAFQQVNFCCKIFFNSRRTGFEPVQAKPIWFLVKLLNHSDITACGFLKLISDYFNTKMCTQIRAQKHFIIVCKPVQIKKTLTHYNYLVFPGPQLALKMQTETVVQRWYD